MSEYPSQFSVSGDPTEMPYAAGSISSGTNRWFSSKMTFVLIVGS